MWLDRLSGTSTPAPRPSASSTPQSRSYSPVPRKSSRLLPQGGPQRPNFSPRSSSLSAASNDSTTSLLGNSRKPTDSSGSNLRNTTLTYSDPIEVLDRLLDIDLGRSLATDKDEIWDNDELLGDVDFTGLALHEFVQDDVNKPQESQAQAAKTYEIDQARFEDLHQSIRACNDILNSVELNLTSFQNDLGDVSAEIETLRARSTTLSSRLENRKVVEHGLTPVVEEVTVSQTIVKTISEGEIDETWIVALNVVGKWSKALNAKATEAHNIKSVIDLLPLRDQLVNIAIERIRDFLVAQIKALRSPNINAQIVQQRHFIRYKDLFSFLWNHHQTLAEEIGQAYMNTMRWYYLNHFTRYERALSKVKIHVIDKHDVLGNDDGPRKSTLLSSSKAAGPPHDAFSLGRRNDILTTSNQIALPSHLAEEDTTTHYLEFPFRNFNLALIDNTCAEYSFLTTFFSPSLSFQSIARYFNYIFSPTFELGHNLTKSLVSETFDSFGLLLCVRLNQKFNFKLQRHKIPVGDSYINGTNMLLWPRFQVIMDLHCESVRKLTANLPSAPPTSKAELAKQSAAPSFMAQRFGQLIQGILELSKETGDDEPVSTSLARLRGALEAFLARVAKAIDGQRKRESTIKGTQGVVEYYSATLTADIAAVVLPVQFFCIDVAPDMFHNMRVAWSQINDVAHCMVHEAGYSSAPTKRRMASVEATQGSRQQRQLYIPRAYNCNATAKLIDYVKDVYAAEKQILSVQAEIDVIRYILYALNTSVGEDPKIFHVTLAVLSAEDGVLHEFYTFLVSFKEKLVAKPGRKLLWPFDKHRIKQDLEKIQRYKTILICALLNDSILLTKKIKDGVDTIKRGVEEITTALDQQKKHDTLEWLSPTRRIDFSQQQATLTAIRAKNTGRWLIESKPFGLWLDGNQDSIILKGGGGMGKTMLASNAIEHLTALTAMSPKTHAIAYAFGNWAHADKFNAQNLLANLLKQILSVKGGQVPETLEELHSSKTYPTYPQLCRLLQLELGRFSKTFIIVDALNELNEDTQDKILKTITELQTSVPIKLMVTSRDPYRVLQYSISATVLDIRATKEDLELWMDESLGALPPGCFVAKSSLETHHKIKATLARAADGMFLLAKLSMNSISKIPNRKKLNQALESIASGSYTLDEAYNDTMERLKTQYGGMQAESIILLSFVTHASRELTVSELEHAMAIEVDEPSFDTDNISDLREAIDSCSGLVAIDPEDEKVVLAHRKFIPLHSLLLYANDHKIPPRNTLTAMLQSQDHWWYRRGSIEPQMSLGISGLHICAWFGLLSAATQLIEERVDVNIKDHNQRGPLWYAVYNRKKEAVALLLERGAEISTEGPLLPVFEECVRSSDPEIVKILGGFENYSADRCSDMLNLAAQNPHYGASMAELVLNSYPGVPIEEIYQGFILSSVANHFCAKAILKMLINRGWTIPVDLDIIRVLSNDISSGAEILKCLLDQGDIRLEASVFELAASGMASDVLEELLDYQSEFKFQVDILPLTAEVNEEMFLAVLKRHPHFEITQTMLDRLVRNTTLKSAAMEALFKHAPPETLKVDDRIIISSIRATYCSSSLIQWLLGHYMSSQGGGIPEEILVAAVECDDSLRILNIIKPFDPEFKVTSRIFQATLRFRVAMTRPKIDVIEWLLRHDPHYEIGEDMLTEALKTVSYDGIRMMLSHKPLRPTLLIFSACRDLPTLELLVTQEGFIPGPDVVDSVVEAALRQGNDKECISKVLGHIERRHIRITPASLKAAAANTSTVGALQWVLDQDTTLEITPSVFEIAAHGRGSLKKMELLESRSPGIKMTEEVLLTVCDYGDIKAVEWVLDRTDDIAQITPRVLAVAAGGRHCKKDFVGYMKLLTARNPSVAITEEVMIRACRVALWRSTSSLAWILAEYPDQQLLSETTIAILVHGGQSPPVIGIIKEHIPKLGITWALLVAAATNPFSEKPLELLLSVGAQELLSEPLLKLVAESKKAAPKFDVLFKLHPEFVSVSDALLCAASESRHGPDALEWLIWFTESRNSNQTPLEPHEVMMRYLNRDPPPLITQKMVVTSALVPWAGELLALLLARDPIFTISKEMIEAVCSNWRFGERQCRLLLNHKNMRVSDEVMSVALNIMTREAAVISKLLQEHNDGIDFQ
ncbi:hypothetical protein V492_01728 [Pseudogymnoascus sp. VKM F-4246]|nr:hypothetical protein V492_01728 [Pseudogymnoascus sp. VKM F-4246]